MHLRSIACAVSLAALAVACRAERGPASGQDSTVAAAGRDSLLDRILRVGLDVGYSRDSAQRVLGRRAYRIETKESALEGTDSVFTFAYPGLEIVIRWAAMDSSEYYHTIDLTDTTLALPAPILIGRTTQREILALLGSPTDSIPAVPAGTLAYRGREGLLVLFSFNGEVLSRIAWDFAGVSYGDSHAH